MNVLLTIVLLVCIIILAVFSIKLYLDNIRLSSRVGECETMLDLADEIILRKTEELKEREN